MIDHKKLDDYIKTVEELLLFLREFRDRKREDSMSGDYLIEFYHLKDTLRSSVWPAAVPADTVCDPNSAQDKQERAEGILADMTSVQDLAFLDYGCGEGHVTIEAAKTARLAVGYDPKGSWGTNDAKNLRFTREITKVKAWGPYDVILAWDVLDHCDKPVEELKNMNAFRKGNGPVYIRCHPWTSRHATHLYHDINKAYMHLIFSEKELLTLGYKGLKTAKITRPIETYREWFRQAGFTIKTERPSRVQIDEFFVKEPLVFQRLKQHWPNQIPDISVEFVDYILA